MLTPAQFKSLPTTNPALREIEQHIDDAIRDCSGYNYLPIVVYAARSEWKSHEIHAVCVQYSAAGWRVQYPVSRDVMCILHLASVSPPIDRIPTSPDESSR